MSRGEPKPAASVPVNPSEDEYAVLDLRTSWPVLSLICFVGALGARFLIGLLPTHLVGWLWRGMLPTFGVLGLSSLGLLFGLLGLRQGKSRELAWIGIALNALGLLLGALAVFTFFWILRR